MQQPNFDEAQKAREKSALAESWRQIMGTPAGRDLSAYLTQQNQRYYAEFLQTESQRKDNVTDLELKGRLQMIWQINNHIEAVVRHGDAALERLAKNIGSH